MKRALFGMAILATIAFGFVSNASAVDIDLFDGHSLSWAFNEGGITGHLLTGTEIAALGGVEYEVLLFSACSSAIDTKVYADGTLEDKLDGVMTGYIGKSYGDLALGVMEIVRGRSVYNFADSINYNGILQAYIIDEEVMINDLLYGVGSLFIGFEDDGDYDYNDAVLAFRVAPPVPVPAAVWLLGTGLAGLVTLRRKGIVAGQ